MANKEEPSLSNSKSTDWSNFPFYPLSKVPPGSNSLGEILSRFEEEEEKGGIKKKNQ